MCEQNLPKGEKGGRHQTCSFFIPQMVLLEKESGADPLGAERLQGDGPSWASFPSHPTRPGPSFHLLVQDSSPCHRRPLLWFSVWDRVPPLYSCLSRLLLGVLNSFPFVLTSSSPSPSGTSPGYRALGVQPCHLLCVPLNPLSTVQIPLRRLSAPAKGEKAEEAPVNSKHWMSLPSAAQTREVASVRMAFSCGQACFHAELQLFTSVNRSSFTPVCLF